LRRGGALTLMADFGTRLREARERRGIALRQIADRTKISMASLEALERSDAKRLPGGIIARSFVRAYASEVGLDPDATVRDFLERFGDDPRFASVADGALEPMDPAPAPRAGHAAVKLLLVALAAMGIILYLTMLRRGPERSADPRPESAQRTTRAEPLPIPAWILGSALR
jgi:cytoskeleton protein RodZ